MADKWVYLVDVPESKSDAFVDAIIALGLLDNINVLSNPEGTGALQ